MQGLSERAGQHRPVATDLSAGGARLRGKQARIALMLVSAIAVVLAAFALAASSAQASFPGVNGKIAYKQNVIWALNPDGTSVPLTTDRSDRLPAYSPDGETVAFVRDVTSFRKEVWIRNADGSQASLSNPTGASVDSSDTPAFSPDGTTIAFVRGGIVLTNLDGTGERALPTTPTSGPESSVSQPAFSPDGSRIAYRSAREFGNHEISVIDTNDPDGSTQKQLTKNPASDEMPNFSPNGRRIVFHSKRDGNFEIYAMDAVDLDGDGNGDNLTRLTTNAAEDAEPAFSPDGTKVVFQSNRDGNSEIYAISADGTGTPANLTNSPVVGERHPDWGRVSGSAPPASQPQCADGTDNDGDTKVDLADPGCSSASDDSESPDPQGPSGGGTIADPTPAVSPAPTPILIPIPGLPPDTTRPLLSGLSFSRTGFRAYASGPSISTARGTRVAYTLSEPALVSFRVERALSGRRVGGRCVRPSRTNRSARRCTRYPTMRGSFSDRGERGSNRFTFRGRLAGHALRPGRYRLRAVATDRAGNRSLLKRTGFRIVRR